MKQYRVLILEDNVRRMNEFYDRIKESQTDNIQINVDHSEYAENAIKLLKKNKYDLILLDHDLGGKTYVDTSDKNTGSEVARFINSSNLDLKDSPIIIHSMNEIAAESMRKLIVPKAKVIKVQGIWFKKIWDSVIVIQ